MLLRSVFALVFAAGAASAAPADAEKILGRVARTYREIRTLSIEATIVLEAEANGMRLELPMTAARRAPAEARIDVTNPMMSTQTVSDGRHVWKYADRLQQYTKRPASRDVTTAAGGPGQILAGEAALSGLKSAALTGRERVVIAGRPIECDVIEALYVQDGSDQLRTYWVDRRRHWILKMRVPVEAPASGRALMMTETITVSSIQTGHALQDGLFVFAPPAGASEVEDFAAAATRPRP